MLLPDGAFTALLLLLVSGVSASVPPPTNVTVSCQTFKITASWAHSRPHTSFRIKLTGGARDYETVTREHHYDLTESFWKSEDRFLDFCFITVTAVEGGEESEAVVSNTFSFNTLKTVKTKCTLEFPPVDVHSHDSGATVSFPNPVHFYPKLKEKSMPTFSSTISLVTDDQANKTSFKCTDREHTCKVDVPIPEGLEKCVQLEGLLLDGMGFKEVAFRKTDPICAPPLTELQMIILLSVLLSIFVLVLTGIVAFICMTKAWNTEKPKCLIVDPEKIGILPEQNETISQAYIDCLKDNGEGELSESSSHVDKWVPEERAAYRTGRSEEAYRTGRSEGEYDIDHSAFYPERDLEGQSHYMSRQRIKEDMGDGDKVQGYKGFTNLD